MKGEKYSVNDEVFYSPPKGDFVTIDEFEKFGLPYYDYENSAENWCQHLHGELIPYLNDVYSGRCTFIKLWSRRFASYRVECDQFMIDNEYDVVFVTDKVFHFCGDKVNNKSYTPQELEAEGVYFEVIEYGDDCCGYNETYYINDGEVFSLVPVQ